jgi:hypothetical protein
MRPKIGATIAFAAPLNLIPKKTKPAWEPSFSGFKKFDTAISPRQIAKIVNIAPRLFRSISAAQPKL